MPSAQRSAARPLNGRPPHISGAKNAGVPADARMRASRTKQSVKMQRLEQKVSKTWIAVGS